MKRTWLTALCAVVLALVGNGCTNEAQVCDSPESCLKFGVPPPGWQYACMDNGYSCRLKPIPPSDAGVDAGTDAGTDAGVTCSPACASGQVCDTSADAGVCRTCTVTQGCSPGQTCDTAGNQGAGVCVPVPATTSGEIGTFLDAGTGALSPPLSIEGAYVTSLRPIVGDESAGFFLQAEPNGPAMYVSPSDGGGFVHVGDRVTLSVTQKTVLSEGIRAATEVGSLTVVSSNNPVQNLATTTPPGLAVDRSDAGTNELVGNLDAHESQLLFLQGAIAAGPGVTGPGTTGFAITTAGVPSVTGTFRLAMPAQIVSDLEVAQGCNFTLKAGPMWRSGTYAQPSAYDESNLILSQCPGPQLVTATPTDASTVQLFFDRQLLASSVSAADFTFQSFSGSPNLTATNATANGNVVTVTTTPQQVSGSLYGVTVSGVQERTGTAITAPYNASSFTGYTAPTGIAALVINEVNYLDPGLDTLEFVEIYNRSSAAVDIRNLQLLFVDGSSTASPRSEYARFSLSNATNASGTPITTLPAGGYLVAASATFFQQVLLPGNVVHLVIAGTGPNPDQDIIRNGPGDGIGLLDNSTGTLIDSIIYDGAPSQGSVFTIATGAGTKSLTFGEGTPTSSVAGSDLGVGNDSLHRFPNGWDTNNNNSDFVYLRKFSPGAPLPAP